MCIDKSTLKSVDVSERFPPLYEGITIDAKSLTKDDPNLVVLAFLAGNLKEFSANNKVDKNKCEIIPIGYLSQKVEQLKILGFQPITVSSTLFYI